MVQGFCLLIRCNVTYINTVNEYRLSLYQLRLCRRNTRVYKKDKAAKNIIRLNNKFQKFLSRVSVIGTKASHHFEEVHRAV